MDLGGWGGRRSQLAPTGLSNWFVTPCNALALNELINLRVELNLSSNMNHNKKALAEQNWKHNTDLMSAKDLAALDAVMEAGFKFNLGWTVFVCYIS